MTVQEMLKELISRKYTIEWVADKFKVTGQTIRNWMNGESSPSHIEEEFLIKLYRSI